MASTLLSLTTLAVAVHCVLSCCMPERWEGLEGVHTGNMINGTGGSGQGLVNVHFDATVKKMAIIGDISYNGQQLKQHILYDAGHGKKYEVYNGYCTKSAMQVPSYKINCLPPDAKKIQSSYYGAGDETFAFDMYEFTAFTGEKEILSLSRRTCIPMGGTAYQSTGFSDFSFVNITAGIKDMSVFDVPKECSSKPVVLG